MSTLSRRDFMAGAGAAAGGAVILSLSGPALGQSGEVQVGIPAETSNNLPMMLAGALGYLKDEGITGRVLSTGGGVNVRQMVAAGQIQYGMGDVAHPLAITGAGKQAKVLIAIDKLATVANVMVRKELWDQGIRTVEDFGKWKKPDGTKPSLGVTRVGSATWLYGSFIFSQAGLIDNINFVSVGDGAPMLGAFRTGKIDALMANIVTYFSVLDEDMGRPIFDVTQKGAWDKYFGSAIPSQCLFALEDQMKAQPAMTQGIVNSCYRALKFIEKTSAKELFAAIEGKYMSAFKPEVAVREMEFMKPIFDYDGSITPEMYKNGAKIWFTEETKIRPQPYERMVDLSLLQVAKKKFG